MRNRSVWMTLAVVFGGLLLAAPLLAQQDAARAIFRLTNQDRVRHGLSPLRWNEGLEQSAAAHLERMAGKRRLSHQYLGEAALPERARQAGVAYSEVAENLAAGFSPEDMENGWMHSPAHRRNILDPGLDAVGLAAERDGRRLYVVEDFAHVIEARGPEQVEQRVASLLRQQGIGSEGSHTATAAARAACSSRRGIPGGPQVRLVIRFQTSNLDTLPQQVVAALHQGHYTKAAVGVCAPQGAQPGFTSFRVAVLLY